jgi:hypothetical protein
VAGAPIVPDAPVVPGALAVEDVVLLVLHEEIGPRATVTTLLHPLGGAVLVDLALLGRIGTAGPAIVALGHGPLPDPLLRSAHDITHVTPPSSPDGVTSRICPADTGDEAAAWWSARLRAQPVRCRPPGHATRTASSSPNTQVVGSVLPRELWARAPARVTSIAAHRLPGRRPIVGTQE